MFRGLGARRFRIELLRGAPEELDRTINQSPRVFGGEIPGSQLWRELKLINQLGVTRGQLAGRQS